MKFTILTAAVFLAGFSDAFSFGQNVLNIGNLAADYFYPTPATQTRFQAAKFDLESVKNKFQSHGIPHQRRPDHEWDHIVKSQEFPNHGLRMKATPQSLGVDTVKQYSGYFDIEDETKHLFFWFFESRNDPENDPVVLWLNGGPGCSSMTGLFFELGPSGINKEIKPIRNPHSWNSNASVIFLDQPVNVGFSYSEKTVGSTRVAGRDVYAMLNLFFKKFPKYNGNGFHIAGESYAGHYIPGIATEIMSHDDRLFDLTSIMIGNGVTDLLRQAPSLKMMACGEGDHPSVLDEDTCLHYNDYLPLIEGLIQKCYNHQDPFRCVPAEYAVITLLEPYQKAGLNTYDVRAPCEESDLGLCYKGLDYINEYLNRFDVQAALGVETTTFESCSDSVMNSFVYSGDGSKPFHFDIVKLLDTYQVPVLIYVGDKDFVCNWIGQNMWLDALDWSGSAAYLDSNLTSWSLGQAGAAGESKNANGLTYVRIYGAGHMAPYDQPENSLDMLNRWIQGQGFEDL